MLEGADDLDVRLLDGPSRGVEGVIAFDAERDLALIKITILESERVLSAQFANLGRTRVGDGVVVIGSPAGLDWTVSSGVVSRMGGGDVQTDAPVSQGSSGGGMFNACGELVGIARASRNQNLNFFIPVDLVEELLSTSRTGVAMTLADLHQRLGCSVHTIPGNDARAVARFRRGADQGCAVAQYRLGAKYAIGNGVPKDDDLAAAWVRKAADQGLADAQYALGGMFLAGRGVPRDEASARAWFRNAAEQGLANAQRDLGYLLRDGQGGPQDDVSAAAWFRRAAEQGLSDAQYQVGLGYYRGRDDTRAAEWWREAANQGDKIAQAYLGILYEEGLGVNQDYKQALVWYRRAADQGLADAQNNLGDMFAAGRGVPQDDGLAAAWFRKAASQGHSGAQARLGSMYLQGLGVSRDLVLGAMWTYLADLAAGTDLWNRLTIDQRVRQESLTRARECVGSDYGNCE